MSALFLIATYAVVMELLLARSVLRLSTLETTPALLVDYPSLIANHALKVMSALQSLALCALKLTIMPL